MCDVSKLLATTMVAIVLLAGTGPIAAAGAAGNASGNDALTLSVANDAVTVTHDGSPVADAAVTAESTGENVSYRFSGTTDESGTVELPAPDETVTVAITATSGELTGSTETELAPDGTEADAFGQRVAAHVRYAKTSGSSGPLGASVSTFVLANNPSGDVPDHAGPPAWLTDGDEDDRRGPPEHAGPKGDPANGSDTGGNGPPGDRGPDTDKGKDKEKGDRGNGNGPKHADEE